LKIDPDDFRRHYASLSDDALMEIERDELVPAAQQMYDEEIARRHLGIGEPAEEDQCEEEQRDAIFPVDENWIESAASACSETVRRGGDATDRMLHARSILTAAGIPAEIQFRNDESQDPGEASLCEVLVPGNLSMYAASVLDKEIFNNEVEEAYRVYFSILSNEELQFADRQLLFAGLEDRLARAKLAYADELARRGQ